jgi:REP element-mobilizing transposase RayT
VPRPLRDQSAGIVHLIWRGNRRQRIFDDDLDRERYLALLGEVCRRLGWRVIAYCLMTNHVHLVVLVTDGTLSRGMQWLGGRYAQWYNLRHRFAGHLFQGRFRSERVEDDSYALVLGRYVDLNPERAGMADAARWHWSSLRAHLGLEPPRSFHDASWLLGLLSLDRRRAQEAYRAFVREGRGSLLPPRPDTAPRLIDRGQTPGPVAPGHVFMLADAQPTP